MTAADALRKPAIERDHDVGVIARDAPDPPLRREGGGAVQRRQDSRLPAPLYRRGSHRGRRPSGPDVRRRGRRHVPRARSRSRARDSGCGRNGGDVRQGQRLLIEGRGGSMHLFDIGAPLLRGLRYRRRRAPDCSRAGAGRQAAESVPGDGLLLWGWRRRRRRVPRVAQPRAGAATRDQGSRRPPSGQRTAPHPADPVAGSQPRSCPPPLGRGAPPPHLGRHVVVQSEQVSDSATEAGGTPDARPRAGHLASLTSIPPNKERVR